ncbi:unnamed protein product [Clonostachys rhizophaga]|uniref:Uncharacterized protein n=1 Tax=Clonostachys rhizophaga TaxID=160324 RepID=A0A9N9YE86_9HYPO|nr:unnamed protein product [Clonostachys rhizophaga]
MAYQGQSRLIEDHPIGSNLDAFRNSFTSLCKDRAILHSPDPLAHLAHEGRGSLRNDPLKLISAVASDEFDFGRANPLLKSALADELDDILIWNKVYNAVIEPTPPPVQ